MPAGSFENLSLASFRGKYIVLFLYALDLTFVCTTEMIAFADQYPTFQQLDVQFLTVSVDSKYAHWACGKSRD